MGDIVIRQFIRTVDFLNFFLYLAHVDKINISKIITFIIKLMA